MDPISPRASACRTGEDARLGDRVREAPDVVGIRGDHQSAAVAGGDCDHVDIDDVRGGCSRPSEDRTDRPSQIEGRVDDADRGSLACAPVVATDGRLDRSGPGCGPAHLGAHDRRHDDVALALSGFTDERLPDDASEHGR